MILIDLIKSKADSTPTVNSFGVGLRAYANLEQENESLTEYSEPMFPRVWMYPYESDDIINHRTMRRSYYVMLDITDLHNFDDSSDQISTKLLTMDAITDEVILRISKDDNVEEISNIKRAPLAHQSDHNEIGFRVTFKIKLKRDDTVYPC